MINSNGIVRDFLTSNAPRSAWLSLCPTVTRQHAGGMMGSHFARALIGRWGMLVIHSASEGQKGRECVQEKAPSSEYRGEKLSCCKTRQRMRVVTDAPITFPKNHIYFLFSYIPCLWQLVAETNRAIILISINPLDSWLIHYSFFIKILSLFCIW